MQWQQLQPLGRRIGLAAISALLVAGPCEALAQAGSAQLSGAISETASIPAETFFRPPRLREVSLSPSGRYLSALLPSAEGRMALGVIDLQTMALPTVVAGFSNADVRSAWWVSEDWLAFDVFDAQSGNMDQPRGSGLFSVRRGGGAFRTLVRPNRDFVREREVAGVRPLEANHVVLQDRAGGNALIVGQVHWGAVGEVEFVTPKRLDVETGRATVIVADAPRRSISWRFDRKGEARVAVSTMAGRDEVYWRAPGSDAWKSLGRFDTIGAEGFDPEYVDASGQLFVRKRTADGFGELRRFDFDRGRPSEQAIISTPGFDFDGAFIEDRAEGHLLGVRVSTDAMTTVWFDPRLKQLQQAVDQRFPGTVNQIECRRCGSDDPVVLVMSYSDREPGFFTLYRPKETAWLSIGRSRPEVDPAKMARLDFHRFKSRDGFDTPVWVTTPRSSSTQPAAAVVLVHGGPWVRGGEWRWSADAQFFASRGYVVIEPEYRGSTGFGFQHYQRGWKNWGTTMQDDVADAVSWAAGKGMIDPKRVCIAGASYGGYATLMSAVRYPDNYRCGIAWVGVSDPRLMFDETWQNDYSLEGQRLFLPRLIGDPRR